MAEEDLWELNTTHDDATRSDHVEDTTAEAIVEPITQQTRLPKCDLDEIHHRLRLSHRDWPGMRVPRTIALLDAWYEAHSDALQLFELERMEHDTWTLFTFEDRDDQRKVVSRLRGAQEWLLGIRIRCLERPPVSWDRPRLWRRSGRLVDDDELSARVSVFNYSVVRPLVDVVEQTSNGFQDHWERRSNREEFIQITKRLRETLRFIMDEGMYVRIPASRVDAPTLREISDQAQQLKDPNIEVVITGPSNSGVDFSYLSTLSSQQDRPGLLQSSKGKDLPRSTGKEVIHQCLSSTDQPTLSQIAAIAKIARLAFRALFEGQKRLAMVGLAHPEIRNLRGT
ncbi:MAG: hypothetical protein M1828_005897 [Chrysothrix sp. TS-e1954]|nr:MAG: hypothetical protein M1828_005897 [Chrysothrix sp. TS-e1954]